MLAFFNIVGLPIHKIKTPKKIHFPLFSQSAKYYHHGNYTILRKCPDPVIISLFFPLYMYNYVQVFYLPRSDFTGSLHSEDGRVFMHPSSVNSEKNFPSNWFVYHEKVAERVGMQLLFLHSECHGRGRGELMYVGLPPTAPLLPRLPWIYEVNTKPALAVLMAHPGTEEGVGGWFGRVGKCAQSG